jgi:hypothetical protein
MKKYSNSFMKTQEIWDSVDMGKVMKKFIQCQRCGLCCKAGVCSVGKEDKNGRCKFLKKLVNGQYSCKLFADGKVKGGTIGIGNGCVIHALPKEFTKFYEDRYGGLP